MRRERVFPTIRFQERFVGLHLRCQYEHLEIRGRHPVNRFSRFSSSTRFHSHTEQVFNIFEILP